MYQDLTGVIALLSCWQHVILCTKTNMQDFAESTVGDVDETSPWQSVQLTETCRLMVNSDPGKPQVPEMQRSELAGTVLQLKALGVDNMMAFDWLAPPPAETMVRALELLHALGALDANAKSAAASLTMLHDV